MTELFRELTSYEAESLTADVGNVYPGQGGTYYAYPISFPGGGGGGGGSGGGTGTWSDIQYDPEEGWFKYLTQRDKQIDALAIKIAEQIAAKPDSDVNEYAGLIWIDQQGYFRSTTLVTDGSPSHAWSPDLDITTLGVPDWSRVVSIVHNHPDKYLQTYDPSTGQPIYGHSHNPTPSLGDMQSLKQAFDYANQYMPPYGEPTGTYYWAAEVSTYVLHDGILKEFTAASQDWSNLANTSTDTSWAVADPDSFFIGF